MKDSNPEKRYTGFYFGAYCFIASILGYAFILYYPDDYSGHIGRKARKIREFEERNKRQSERIIRLESLCKRSLTCLNELHPRRSGYMPIIQSVDAEVKSLKNDLYNSNLIL